MTTTEVRFRFSKLLKELYVIHGDGRTVSQFHDSLKHFRQESISRIANDKQGIKDEMIVELLNLDPDISLEWIFTGTGTMFKSHNTQEGSTDTRVDNLESEVKDLKKLLTETLKLTRQDLKNRGLLE